MGERQARQVEVVVLHLIGGALRDCALLDQRRELLGEAVDVLLAERTLEADDQVVLDVAGAVVVAVEAEDVRGGVGGAGEDLVEAGVFRGDEAAGEEAGADPGPCSQ